MILFFLSSGLFLGWSLGANDAANVFGTAVGTRMIKFTQAAIICSVFCILGAVIGGAGTTDTLGRLGSVNALGGSFVVALAAALTVFGMTRLSLPVSTSQAIVGAIVGWNLFTGSLTDTGSLVKIVSTWVLCPVISAVCAMILYSALRAWLGRAKLHLLREDTYTRWGLIIVGAFGAYSLGANNIANVMGVFVPVAPFRALSIPGVFTLSGTQQLFLLGGLAIALGVFTYSHRVMRTVGGNIFRLDHQTAFVVVMTQAVVLFLFSSQDVERLLIGSGLPSIPLVPVSSTQAVVGAVIGIALVKGGKGIRYRVLGEISLGWITSPIIAGLLAFMALFFVQNVFDVQVQREVKYVMSQPVLVQIEKDGLDDPGLQDLLGRRFERGDSLDETLRRTTNLDRRQRRTVTLAAERDRYFIDPETVEAEIARHWSEPGQADAVRSLSGRQFRHRWEMLNALAAASDEWRDRPDTPANRLWNRDLEGRRELVVSIFRSQE